MRTHPDAKAMARSLRAALAARSVSLSHGQCLEIVAQQLGFADWNTLSSKLKPAERRRARPKHRDADVRPTGLDAGTVLRRMVARYASLTSYVDTGEVRTRLATSGAVYRVRFSTLYQKPSFFRFSFFRPHPHPPLGHLVTEHVVGCDGHHAYSLVRRHDGAPAERSDQALGAAVARATGISSGSAHTIGRLLLPEVGGLSILDLRDPKLNPDVELDGVACYSVTARSARGGARELWIEKERLLLRRITGARSEELRENIQVDEALGENLFAT